MRFYTVLASRPQYYDRSPAQNAFQYVAATIAPHATTARFTYTVPANRKAMIGFLTIEAMRDGAAGAAGAAGANITITPSGSSAKDILDVRQINNNVGTPIDAAVSGNAILLAGDAFTGNTFDLSTGGTYTYALGAQAIEFDS